MTTSTGVSSFGRSLLIPPPATAQRRWHSHRPPVAGARLLASIETAVAVGALGFVIVVTNLHQIPQGVESLLAMRITLRNVLLLAVLAGGWTLVFRACGLYDATRIERVADERRRVCAAVSLGTLLALALTWLSASGGLRPLDLAFFWCAAPGGGVGVRALRRTILRNARGWRRRRVLIVGTSLRALRMWQTLAKDYTTSHELAGFIDCPGNTPATLEVARLTIGTLDELESTLVHGAIDEVCIALPVKSRYREIQETLLVCERVGVRTKYGADLFETRVAWPRFEPFGSPFVTLQVVPDDYRLIVKRGIDVAGALVGLMVCSPLMLAAAIAIKAKSPGPVIFAQDRYGLNRRRFRMFKFRTMVDGAERLQSDLEAMNEAEGPVFKIASDPRVTGVGRVLRRTSIDELPQLFNVLRGDMSLVGPRPLPLRDVDRFTHASDMRRFSVRPGLTCLWQVNGRSTLGFAEWIALDLAYIDGWSLVLDLSILVRTIPVVLRGTGAQ